MIQIYLYTNENHAEAANRIESTVLAFKNRFDLNLNRVEIPSGNWLNKDADIVLPELRIGDHRIVDPVSATSVESALLRAVDYLHYSTERRDQPAINSISNPIQLTGSDKLGLWFSRYYVWFVSFLVLIYVGLPLLAPVLMKTGHPSSANFIYRGYRLVCHELGYRSFYMFGEQVAYPRELAGVDGLKTFEAVSGLRPEDLTASSLFVGNESVGYKVALCQRDVAMYGSILLFGIIFGLTKRKFKAIPWYVWLIVALGPIGLDGVSQLVSQMNLSFLSWLPMRESTPFLRVLSGFLFGWFTAWFAFPTIEESLRPTRVRTEMRALADELLRSA